MGRGSGWGGGMFLFLAWRRMKRERERRMGSGQWRSLLRRVADRQEEVQYGTAHRGRRRRRGLREGGGGREKRQRSGGGAHHTGQPSWRQAPLSVVVVVAVVRRPPSAVRSPTRLKKSLASRMPSRSAKRRRYASSHPVGQRRAICHCAAGWSSKSQPTSASHRQNPHCTALPGGAAATTGANR